MDRRLIIAAFAFLCVVSCGEYAQESTEPCKWERICGVIDSLADCGQNREAISLGRTAFAGTEDEEAMVRVRLGARLGRLYYMESMPDSMYFFFNAVTDDADRLEMYSESMMIHNVTGVYNLLNALDYENALFHFQQGLECAGKSGDEDFLHKLLVNISIIHYMRKDPAGITTFNAEAESRQLEFSCTEQWFISYEPVEWLDVSPLSGEAGNVSVTLTVGMNETGEERSTSFTVISGSSNETVTVIQGTGNGNTDGMEFDPDFAEFLIANHDTDGDGILSVEEAAAVKSLEITDEICVLTSLRGIKNLVGLETLNCSYNSISGTLDLSCMTSLTEVRCDHNPILELDVSGCSSLKTLKANDMTGYILERLDLTGCTALEALECHDGNLSELDLSDCTSLKDINCCFNNLTEIYFTGCDRLVNVTTRDNPMYGFTLDLSDRPDLVYVNCSTSHLGGLDVSGCPSLNQLIAYTNSIPSIDVSASTKLTSLSMYSNALESVDLSENTQLTGLDVASNRLTSLDVSHNTAITSLTCWMNQITSLDLSGLKDLQTLSCHNNSIETLTLTGCPALYDIQCYNNALSEIDLSECLGAIRSLTIYGNTLASLDLSGSTVEYLYCQDNELTELNLKGCSKIVMLNCSSNSLTTLDVSDASGITELLANANMLTSVNLPSSSVLTTLELGGNQLSKIDLRGCPAINSLTLAKNNFSQLSVNFLTAMGYIDVSMNQIRSLDLSNLTGLMSVFCSENGMESLYLNENANLNSLQTDPDTEVFYVPGRGYDDVNTDDWGDTEINPWN